MNSLYYGDNLDVLRRHVADESVDLVYLDPPFNSNANYNVLFAEQDGTRAASQIKAFNDTWKWDEGAARAFEEVVEAGGRVSQVMQAFRTFLADTDMLAYLAMMAPRLMELRRVMKPRASIYLHCDPTASHYLKMLLDAIFAPQNFLNEIVWQRSTAHSDAKQGMQRLGRIHDVLLLYKKTDDWIWNTIFIPYDQTYIDSHYRHVEERTGRRFRKGDVTANHPGGDTSYEFHGVRPYKGRYWAYSKEKMEEFHRSGRLVYTKTGMPEYKRYLDEMPGVPLQDVWTDIAPINSQAQERLGYPTQKPEALMERVISLSTNVGDTVLDPFCGCGTTIAAAEKLERRWIGIDITNLAITLIRGRLTDTFVGAAKYEVIGEPVSLPDAAALAASEPYQFQWWALGLVGARPVEEKKGADKGVDGRIYFHEGSGKTKQIVLSVKAGKLHATYVRDLRGVLEREKADIGVMISLEEPTGLMRREAASAGFYTSPWGKHARLQLVTIEDLLTGRTIDRPPIQTSVTFKRAPKAVTKGPERKRLDFEGPETEEDEPETDEPD